MASAWDGAAFDRWLTTEPGGYDELYYTCNYCNKEFMVFGALEDHQNACNIDRNTVIDLLEDYGYSYKFANNAVFEAEMTGKWENALHTITITLLHDGRFTYEQTD